MLRTRSTWFISTFRLFPSAETRSSPSNREKACAPRNLHRAPRGCILFKGLSGSAIISLYNAYLSAEELGLFNQWLKNRTYKQRFAFPRVSESSIKIRKIINSDLTDGRTYRITLEDFGGNFPNSAEVIRPTITRDYVNRKCKPEC